jgi:hypothetical protein
VIGAGRQQGKWAGPEGRAAKAVRVVRVLPTQVLRATADFSVVERRRAERRGFGVVARSDQGPSTTGLRP